MDALGKCCQNNCKGSSREDRWVYNENETYNDLAVAKYMPYKFVIAHENCVLHGYITEKLVNPMLAGAIPIYVGAPNVSSHFNTKSFINMHDFATLDECLDHVLKVDSDPTLYKQMLKEPWFVHNRFNRWIPEYHAYDGMKHKFQAMVCS